MAKGCVLKGLETPQLQGALPGLTLTDRELRLTPGNFLCCGGTGLQLGEAEQSYRCNLRARTAAVAALVSQFRRTWGDEVTLPLALSSKDVADLASRLSSQNFATAKGRSLARQATAKGPSPLWAVALAAAWRFGTCVHVATLGRTPWHELTKKDLRHPLVVIVERIDELWDVRRADELEFVVGWAYQVKAQLWCDWLLHAPPAHMDPRRSASMRIANMRSRSPLRWLSADMHSKLQFVTEGLDPIVRWPASKAKSNVVPPPGRSVDLPPKIH